MCYTVSGKNNLTILLFSSVSYFGHDVEKPSFFPAKILQIVFQCFLFLMSYIYKKIISLGIWESFKFNMSVCNPWTFRFNQTKPLFLFLCNIPLDHDNNLQAVSYSIILYFSLLHHFSLKHLSPINIMNIFINLLYLFSAFSHIKHKLHREYSPVPRIVPSTC